ncbi:MAG: drug/metabolite transporter (DMT)-like permease [Patiriisocius sp.]|jgi:drug/metabolite transporter (DMT)-like permease
MTWFLLALIGPLLYAMTNHIDKILLEKYFKEGGVGTLLLFSSLLSILALPVIYMTEPDILNVSLFNAMVLVLAGILDLLVLFCYFMALKDDEASIIVVFYQLVPIFGLGLGYLILGETLTQIQLIAMGIIILGTTIVAFEIDTDNNFTVRRGTVFYMLAAGIFWALEATIFKMVALEEDVLQSLFWNSAILVVLGSFMFCFITKYRKHFIAAVRNNSRNILGANVVNEVLYMLGNTALAFAAMLAPIALILLMESFQAFFVLLIGIILTLFFPHISEEKIHLQNVIQKLLAITVTAVGTYILLFVA